jgi:transposase
MLLWYLFQMFKEADLPSIPEQLRPLVASMNNRVVSLLEENNRLRRALFGAKTETHITGDLIHPKGCLFNEAEALIEEAKVEEKLPAPVTGSESKPRTRSPESGGRKPFPEDLPRNEIVCDLPESQKVCPHDGTVLQKISEKRVEILVVEPAKATVDVHVYPVYGCPCCKGHMAQQQSVPAPIPHASCDATTLAFVLMQKYLWGLPLYRIERQFIGMGVEVPRATLARWVIQCADLLGDLAFEIRKYILEQSSIHADETTVQVLSGTGKVATSKSYMWLISSGKLAKPAVWFEYWPSRNQECAKNLLGNFTGVLHVDGYEGYSRVIAANGITRVGCWAHVRRKFDVAKKDGAKAGQSLAAEFLDDFQKLFMLEREFEALNAEQRVLQRQLLSKPLTGTIRTRLDEYRHKVTPKSKLGEALTYLANQWETLTVFLETGQAELSNNRIENHIRPFAVGRKNWLFSSTAKGAEASALIYTIVCSAKANGVDVTAYLTHLLRELPKRYAAKNGRVSLEEFLPWNFTR